MPKIFVNFRNGDEAMTSSFVYDSLVQRFGKELVFRSSDSIPLGADYTVELEAAARECDVLLVLIGPDWLKVTDSQGRPRLHGADDWVRREIAVALESGRTVVPILVAEASRLEPHDLPPDIRALADLQGLRLRPQDREDDMRRIFRKLRETVPSLPADPDDHFDYVGEVHAGNVVGGTAAGVILSGQGATAKGVVRVGDIGLGGSATGVRQTRDTSADR